MSGLPGETAESSVVTVHIDCLTWDRETETHERSRVVLFSKMGLVPFLENKLSDLAIFRYGTILFHFKVSLLYP